MKTQKALDIDALNRFWKKGVIPVVQTAMKSISDKLGGCALSQDSDGFYIAGEGEAKKKLKLDRQTLPNPVQSGLYKIAVDEYGNVTSAVPAEREDIMSLGIVSGYDFMVVDGSLYVKPKT